MQEAKLPRSFRGLVRAQTEARQNRLQDGPYLAYELVALCAGPAGAPVEGRMRIEGYAVVGDNDRIANAAGEMPEALKNDAEWAFFQAGLDAAQVTILGRSSQEATPNPKRRRRLVMTRSVMGLRANGRIVYWNPEGVELMQALKAFSIDVTCLAIAGGRDVFDHFLTGPARYTHFHLSHVGGVTLPGGRGVFRGIDERGLSAADCLRQAGYEPRTRRRLDDGVHVVTWCPMAS